MIKLESPAIKFTLINLDHLRSSQIISDQLRSSFISEASLWHHGKHHVLRQLLRTLPGTRHGGALRSAGEGADPQHSEPGSSAVRGGYLGCPFDPLKQGLGLMSPFGDEISPNVKHWDINPSPCKISKTIIFEATKNQVLF